MNFTKMHGSGNDYIYVDCFRESVSNPGKLAVRLSDRHKGIGSDGLVLIMPSENSDLRMRMFNADGSEAQMCGNASRCVGKYAYDNGLTHKTELTLETSAGEKKLWLIARDQKVERVKVDMGEPVLDAMDIPVKTDMDRVLNQRTVFPRLTADISCVSMGNPHTVIFTNDIDHLSLIAIGPGIENHSLFPERTNVEFVEVVSPQHARMRVWERGAGETQACGTGACAVLVAGVLNKSLERRAVIDLPGGSLEIEWDISSNHVYMTGDAVTVFKGQIDIYETGF